MGQQRQRGELGTHLGMGAFALFELQDSVLVTFRQITPMELRAARGIELVVKLAARRLRCPLLYPAGCRGFSWAGKPTADVRWFCVRIRRPEGKVWTSTSGKRV